MDYTKDPFPADSEPVGRDLSGRVRKLGDHDCDGEVVGYICGGLTYVSRREAIINRFVERCGEAYDAWRAGIGACPDPFVLADALVPPEYRAVALHEACESLCAWARLKVMARGMPRPHPDLPSSIDPKAPWVY